MTVAVCPPTCDVEGVCMYVTHDTRDLYVRALKLLGKVFDGGVVLEGPDHALGASQATQAICESFDTKFKIAYLKT